MSELQEGDRVQHDIRGEGTIPTYPSGEQIDKVLGVAWVEFDDVNCAEAVALDRLSKVEPETEILPADVIIPMPPEGTVDFPSWADGWAAGWLAASPLEHVEDGKLTVSAVRHFAQQTTASKLRTPDALSGYAEATTDIMNFIDNGLEPLKEPEAEDPEPGVSREELHDRLRAMGAEVPVDPQPDKTLREKLLTEYGNLEERLPIGDVLDEALEVFREHFNSKRKQRESLFIQFGAAMHSMRSMDDIRALLDDEDDILFGGEPLTFPSPPESHQ